MVDVSPILCHISISKKECKKLLAATKTWPKQLFREIDSELPSRGRNSSDQVADIFSLFGFDAYAVDKEISLDEDSPDYGVEVGTVVMHLFEGEDWDEEEEMFLAYAGPFVEDGSEFEVNVANESILRYEFDGEACTRLEGELVYPESNRSKYDPDQHRWELCRTTKKSKKRG